LDEARLQRLVDVGRSLVAELDLETVLRQVLDAARELTGARYAALGILDEDRHALERFVTAGIDEETKARIGDLPTGRGVLGVLIEDPRPLRLADVAHHASSYGFPMDHPPMTTFLGVPILIRGEAWGNLYLTEKEEGPFTADDERAVVVLADWAAIAIDNARLYERERGRRDELERAVHGLEAMTEIARAVGGELDLDRVLELIAKRARALVDARALTILLAEGSELTVVAASGELPDDVLGARIPLDDSVSGEVLRSQRPERLGDLSTRLHFALRDIVDARTGLFVPLAYRGRALGVIAAHDRLTGGAEFRAEDERVMVGFATSAATAVATAQRVEADALRRTIESSEQERRRWARELHDETLQSLAAIKVGLATARAQSAGDVPGDIVDDAVAELDRAIEELRAMLTELRPAALDELGSVPAIEALVDRVRAVSGLDIELEIDVEYDGGRQAQRHTPEVEAALYRIVQEALSNVVKHAEATQATVRVADVDDFVTVVVSDDGVGLSGAGEGAGFGLVGMRERVNLLGGSLKLAAGPVGGTILTARLPAARVAPPMAAADEQSGVA
jgi:signal transduction histidine kinase